MRSTDLILLYSPFPDADSAQKVARTLLSEKLIACANLLPGSLSLYVWAGNLTETDETVLIAKTIPASVADASARIEALHPHETPAILILEATANPAYLSWVQQCIAS